LRPAGRTNVKRAAALCRSPFFCHRAYRAELILAPIGAGKMKQDNKATEIELLMKAYAFLKRTGAGPDSPPFKTAELMLEPGRIGESPAGFWLLTTIRGVPTPPHRLASF
jgi:hypothetical protein